MAKVRAAGEFVEDWLVYEPGQGKRVCRHQLCGWDEIEEGEVPRAGLKLLPKYGQHIFGTVKKAAQGKFGDDVEIKSGTKQKETSYITNVRLKGKRVL